MKKTELLAPAGDYASFIAAINAGADAVYLAGKQFGARAFANNFEEDELLKALDYAHLNNRKIYLTLNTLIKESEFSSVTEYLMPYYNNGLDGIIIQDLGLIPLLKKEFPLLELHASTQMTVNNYRSAAWLKSLGLCRIVPSRELSLEELIEIKNKADIEVEAFIHGAMCYGYSGQCLFSSFLGGRSGNRGRCAQPCRLPYSVTCKDVSLMTAKDIYPLSLKDLCSLPYIYDLLDAGIDSFKIEGRMKSPEYVAGVTSVYRKYIDFYYSGKRPQIEKKDFNILSHLYIRSEMKDGYFKKHNGKDMVSVDSPSYKGADDNLIHELHEKFCEHTNKIAISGELNFTVGQPAECILHCMDKTVTFYGETVEKAQNRPITIEDVRKQINKTGNSNFYFDTLNIHLDEEVFVPIKQLNALRREALEFLQFHLLEKYKRTFELTDVFPISHNNTKNFKNVKPLLRVSVMDYEQFTVIMNSPIDIDRIYIPADILYLDQAIYEKVTTFRSSFGGDIYLSLPRILRKRDEKYLEFIEHTLEFFDGVMVKNIEYLSFIHSIGYKGKIVTDSSVYNWNKQSLACLEGVRDEFTYPLELTLRENISLENTEGEYVVFGRTPMMVSANCIRKTTGCCNAKNNGFSQYITDRYRKALPVYTNCIHCYNEIFNAISMSCHKEISHLLKNGFYKLRLNFSNEDADTTYNILSYYNNLLFGTDTKKEFPLKEYTVGHFKEGAL